MKKMLLIASMLLLVNMVKAQERVNLHLPASKGQVLAAGKGFMLFGAVACGLAAATMQSDPKAPRNAIFASCKDHGEKKEVG